MEWYIRVLNKYAVFTGQAQRAEYWYFVLFNFLFALGLDIFDHIIGIRILSSLYSLVVLIPGIAVAVRRLHDTDRSGWWLLINLIPVIGWIVCLVFLVQDSDPQENRFGPNPKILVGVPVPQPS
jgi:uncharacterized membrane protein YhaH (DUF805 family)